jgi:hypothetical protein
VTFTLNGTGSPTCSDVTNASGVASCGLLLKTSVYNSAANVVVAYAGSTDFSSSQVTEPA